MENVGIAILIISIIVLALIIIAIILIVSFNQKQLENNQDKNKIIYVPQ